MIEWLEKTTISISDIKLGSLMLNIDNHTFEVSFVTNLKKVINDALKLEPYDKQGKTILIDGEDKILFLTFRRYGKELVVLYEERDEEGNREKDVLDIIRFPYAQFRSDFLNTMKENMESYKQDFESYMEM